MEDGRAGDVRARLELLAHPAETRAYAANVSYVSRHRRNSPRRNVSRRRARESSRGGGPVDEKSRDPRTMEDWGRGPENRLALNVFEDRQRTLRVGPSFVWEPTRYQIYWSKVF